MMNIHRSDIYAQVTEAIVADLSKGVRPWSKPWTSGPFGLPVRHNGEPYRGINVVILWVAAMAKGYSSPRWMTYRQAQALGGQVKRGEKSTGVVYAKAIDTTDTNDSGEKVSGQVFLTRSYSVFNAEQIEGLPEASPAVPVAAEPISPIEVAERFFAATGAEFRYGGDKAFYSPRLDYIQMPPLSAFSDPYGFAATKAHELTHWTLHPTRLNRTQETLRFGNEAYAREELVAELGAAFLCATLGISAEPRADHAEYIGDWLQVLQNDHRAIFTAAAQAQRAVDYLHGLQPVPLAPVEEEISEF